MVTMATPQNLIAPTSKVREGEQDWRGSPENAQSCVAGEETELGSLPLPLRSADIDRLRLEKQVKPIVHLLFFGTQNQNKGRSYFP
jgi:hypothetical protein